MKLFADPVAWLWLALVIVALVLLGKGRRRIGWSLLGLAILSCILEVARVPARLMASLERPYLSSAAPAVSGDAVLVLGGGLKPFPQGYLGLELSDSADRLFTGIKLVREGRAKVLVLSGGGARDLAQATNSQLLSPSSHGLTVSRSHALQIEAEAAKRWVEDWKLVPGPVETLGARLTTQDEAVHMGQLAQQRGWKKIILVTSAWHMRRSEATFRKAGLDVIPVGCDFQGTARLESASPPSLIPRTDSLSLLNLWTSEMMGYCYYWLRGYL